MPRGDQCYLRLQQFSIDTLLYILARTKMSLQGWSTSVKGERVSDPPGHIASLLHIGALAARLLGFYPISGLAQHGLVTLCRRVGPSGRTRAAHGSRAWKQERLIRVVCDYGYQGYVLGDRLRAPQMVLK